MPRSATARKTNSARNGLTTTVICFISGSISAPEVGIHRRQFAFRPACALYDVGNLARHGRHVLARQLLIVTGYERQKLLSQIVPEGRIRRHPIGKLLWMSDHAIEEL